MSANKRGRCGACCVRDHSCETCHGFPACAPRYLCAGAEIEWGPYVDLDTVCCGQDPYDIGHLHWRLPFDCDTWSASGTCTGLETPLDITVTVERVDAENCRTKVDSTLMEEPAYFPGVFPADMIVELTTPEGDVATVTIEQADMITLPLATLKCSPCGCVTGCYPRRLCTTVTLAATAYEEATTEAGIIEWDCDHDHWTGTVAEQLIVISGKPVEDQICGLNVVVTGDRAALTGEILLDNGWHPRRFHGAPCRDSDGITMTHGVPELLPCPPEDPECEDPPVEDYVSTLDESFDLMDGDSVVGSLTVRDLSCGEVCEVCLPPVDNCAACPETSLPRTLTYELISEDCPNVNGVTGTLHYTDDIGTLESVCGDPQTGPGWVGSVTFPHGCSGTLWLRCKGSPQAFTLCYDGGDAGSVTTFTTYTCDPLEMSAIFYTGFPASEELNCCGTITVPVTNSITVRITE